ncbi:RNA polymerase II subunit A C-terminal domain phosphatase SSU72 [Stylophora pistillata]|uniref:RNA polymerase II subunit A C-terminal domain phosphatase SSU72 n=1 Tax=Stylophora pistillata TaxID=50429 RepID=A0A2B4SBF4_STYPI|nr:RNA polymerase II subunit A C-terminal domain phosphatase SSU72 [Stylophora pistillata]
MLESKEKIVNITVGVTNDNLCNSPSVWLICTFFKLKIKDQVIEYLESRGAQSYSPVHVINLDIQDNHEEATLGAFLICEMCQAIEGLDDLENEIDEAIPKLEKKWKRTLLHTVAFY